MKRTIVEAIKEVMRAEGRPLSISEIYDGIVSANLYSFKADKPVHIVRSQIRRHCKGLHFPSSFSVKHFEMLPNGKYYVLERPIVATRQGASKAPESIRRGLLTNLKKLHHQHLDDVRRRAIDQIMRFEPASFERFCRNLLEVYGFRDVVVTRLMKDGGIDGHGRLKVGFAYFNIAFQCKRWTRGNVGRPDIDQFRGVIQGQFEQGIFFTTAGFTTEAETSSFKAGAVTIILINGPTIVDIMIEKQFGVEKEDLPVYSLVLDLVISDEN